MTLHLKSREYPFRPRLLFSCFIVVGVGFPTVYYFRRGQIKKEGREVTNTSRPSLVVAYATRAYADLFETVA